MFLPPRNDLDYSRKALEAILSSRRLIFNPYTVSDSRLIEIVERAYWGNQFDLTQAVIMTFTRLRNVPGPNEFDGIYFKLGRQPGESLIPAWWIYNGISSNETASMVRHTCDKRILRNPRDVAWLVGKKVFISRVIRGYSIRLTPMVAYRMHRLCGKTHKDAAKIREAMCSAKIEMLERILTYPECVDYLSCSRGFFDYEPRIRRAIEIISHYSDTIPPADP